MLSRISILPQCSRIANPATTTTQHATSADRPLTHEKRTNVLQDPADAKPTRANCSVIADYPARVPVEYSSERPTQTRLVIYVRVTRRARGRGPDERLFKCLDGSTLWRRSHVRIALSIKPPTMTRSLLSICRQGRKINRTSTQHRRDEDAKLNSLGTSKTTANLKCFSLHRRLHRRARQVGQCHYVCVLTR